MSIVLTPLCLELLFYFSTSVLVCQGVSLDFFPWDVDNESNKKVNDMQAPSQRLTNWILRGRDPGDSDARAQVGKLSGALGIGLNLLLSVLKLVAGALSRSLAMTADALNNLTDAGSSLVTLVGFRVAGQKADAEHPFGHGRAEYVSGLIISLLILLVGLELGKSSVEKIIVPESVAFSWFAAGILALGVIGRAHV